jgi:hypothetical protein
MWNLGLVYKLETEQEMRHSKPPLNVVPVNVITLISFSYQDSIKRCVNSSQSLGKALKTNFTKANNCLILPRLSRHPPFARFTFVVGDSRISY